MAKKVSPKKKTGPKPKPEDEKMMRGTISVKRSIVDMFGKPTDTIEEKWYDMREEIYKFLEGR
jgi:hypothetical protein